MVGAVRAREGLQARREYSDRDPQDPRNGHNLRILRSLLEAFVPSLPAEAQEHRKSGDEVLAKYCEYPGSEGHAPEIAEEALALCETHLPEEKCKDVKMLLWLLSTSLGTLLIGGWQAITTWWPPFARPFDELSVKQREAVLLAWKGSSLASFQQAYKAIQGLVMFTLYASHTPDGKNPLWDFLGYPGADPFKPDKPVPAKLKSEKSLLSAILNLGAAQFKRAEIVYELRKQGLKVVEDKGAGAIEVACDAVVVGSGAGGGVAAGVLAQAGLKVVVVEKGSYTKAEDLTTLEKDAYDGLYERGGLLMATEDGGINIMAGATVGGGTRVNWSVSFRTPDHVRKEWAEVHGLPHFASDRYTKALDAVCRRQGVGTGVRHNKPNQLLWDALENLGADVEEMPRNCRNSERCGHCPHGCPYGEKQDTTATYLVDAAKAGATILAGCFAEKVLLEAGPNPARKRATGLSLHPNGQKDIVIHIRAPIVVASAGSLHNPALLLRSGITCSNNVGQHLHLHCGAAIAARLPKKDASEDPNEGRVKLWEGAIMSTYSREAADWLGAGYGPLVSMTAAHPGLTAAGVPWDGAHAYRELTVNFPWMALCCTYIRDKDSGRVTIGPDGLPRLHYWPSKHDQSSILKGLELGARAMAAAGAEAVFTSQPAPKSRLEIRRNPDGSLVDPLEFEEYIGGIHEQGVKNPGIALFSMHQMGSCRMGSSPADSVADGEGECWECEGLYIADASAFPTASGVNPMITAEAIAYMVADGISSRHYTATAKLGSAATEVKAVSSEVSCAA